MTLDDMKNMVTARNVGLGTSGVGFGYDSLLESLKSLPPDPVYAPEVIEDVITGLEDPANPAYAKPDRFKFIWDIGMQAYRESTPEEKAIMEAEAEEAKARLEVGEITDLGEFEDWSHIPTDRRLAMAGSIVGDDAEEAARMAEYDRLEEAGELPGQDKQVLWVPPAHVGGTAYG